MEIISNRVQHSIVRWPMIRVVHFALSVTLLSAMHSAELRQSRLTMNSLDVKSVIKILAMMQLPR